MKPFSKFGFEPTFFPKIDLPNKIKNNGNWENLYCGYYYMIDQAEMCYDKFRRSIDCGSLERPTRNTYTNYNEFKRDYNKLLKESAKYGLYPSSSICLMSEGGCHINFSLEWVLEKHGEQFTKELVNNYANFVTSNPSIVWMFLSPYDNISSRLVFRHSKHKYEKGEYFTIRFHSNDNEPVCLYSEVIESVVEPEPQVESNFIPILEDTQKVNDATIKYIELRNYMMPRNNKEFDVHFDFANTLMHYIYNFTVNGGTHPFVNKAIKNYTYKQTVGEFSKVCKQIGFDYNRVVGVGKLDLLKIRFKLGKDYLV